MAAVARFQSGLLPAELGAPVSFLAHELCVRIRHHARCAATSPLQEGACAGQQARYGCFRVDDLVLEFQFRGAFPESEEEGAGGPFPLRPEHQTPGAAARCFGCRVQEHNATQMRISPDAEVPHYSRVVLLHAQGSWQPLAAIALCRVGECPWGCLLPGLPARVVWGVRHGIA